MTEQPTTPDPEAPEDRQGGAHHPSGQQIPDGPAAQTPPRPQYGLRSSDLGLPSPYDQYRQQEQDAQAPWPGQNQYGQNQPAQNRPGGNPGTYGNPGYGPGPGQGPGNQAWGRPAAYPQAWQTDAGRQQFPAATPPAPMPVPRTVEWAFWLILSAGMLSLIGALVGLSHIDINAVLDQAMRQAETRQGTRLDPATLKAARNVTVGFMVVMFAVILALYALVAVFVRKGHHWARVLGTVFASISVLGLITTDILSLASTVAGIVGIVLSWLSVSGAYFADARLQRDYRRFQRFRPGR